MTVTRRSGQQSPSTSTTRSGAAVLSDPSSVSGEGTGTTIAAPVQRKNSKNDATAKALQSRRSSINSVVPSASSGSIPQSAAAAGPSANGAMDPAVVDALPEQPFPKRGYKMHPLDEADPLLLMCAKALACCDNRALTPKEIALICSRKWSWSCTGSQPFAVISSCIRSHLRRASTATPPYQPMFGHYELASVPPAEDIPCLGIQPEARPAVKRGTFWFLAESMGFLSPFPHRAPGTLGSTKPKQGSGITLSLLSQGRPGNEEKPVTRAQRSATQTSHGGSGNVGFVAIAPAPAAAPAVLAPSATAASVTGQIQQENQDPLGRGKRKRTASQAINVLPTLQAIQQPNLSSKPAQLQPILPNKPTSPMTADLTTPTAASFHHQQQQIQLQPQPYLQKTRGGAGAGHRRAFSSSASDLPKPVNTLRKLKLRLSAVSEMGPAVASTPTSSPSTSTGVKKTSTERRLSSSTSKKNSSKQPHSKRQRTQSMSQPVSTAAFPFDNLHLHSSIHNHTQLNPAPNGTIYPLDIHNLHSSPSMGFADLLTSRSAPEGGIFSPPTTTANLICGPFSRSHSPTTSTNLRNAVHRSLPSEASFISDAEESVAGTPATGDVGDLSNEMEGVEYEGWSAGHRSLTESAILAAQQEILGVSAASDYHEAMLKNDIDFDFDFSLDSLGTHQRGVDGERQDAEEDSFELVKERSQSLLEGVSMTPLLEEEEEEEIDGMIDGLHVTSGEETGSVKVEKVEEDLLEDEEDEGEEYEEEDGEEGLKAILEGHAFQKVRNMTLCPAAAKFMDNNARPGRLLTLRMNSSSSLIFPKLGETTRSPLLRPAAISRTNSRDILNTPVPLAELPSIPLHSHDNHLFYLTSEPDHLAEEGLSLEDTRSEASTPLTPIIKSEEDADDEYDDLQAGSTTMSRLPSQALSEESSDSFMPEAYLRGRSSTEGGARDLELRSQSSSRRTSISPRDSFSPQASGSHADWALTPPSEEEHVDEEEKNLDRATLLGPESVGMDDLDDVWPGSRFLHLHHAFDDNLRTAGEELEKQAVSTREVEVFEPVLSPAPIPHVDILPAVFVRQASAPLDLERATEAMSMDADLDEHAAAAMFIAEEHTGVGEENMEEPFAEDAEMETDYSTPVEVSVPKQIQPRSSPATAATDEAISTAQAPPSAPAASTVLPGPSFFFSPDTPLALPIKVLLTDERVLFYTLPLLVGTGSRALLRRVDNDAVDAEALMLALIGQEVLEEDDGRCKALQSFREPGNTWIPLEHARLLLSTYGPESSLDIFLKDGLLCSWSEKLIRLGSVLRSKNGLPPLLPEPSPSAKKGTPPPVSAAAKSKNKATAAAAPRPIAPAPPKPILPKQLATKDKTVSPDVTATPATPVSNKSSEAVSSAKSTARRSARNKSSLA